MFKNETVVDTIRIRGMIKIDQKYSLEIKIPRNGYKRRRVPILLTHYAASQNNVQSK